MAEAGGMAVCGTSMSMLVMPTGPLDVAAVQGERPGKEGVDVSSCGGGEARQVDGYRHRMQIRCVESVLCGSGAMRAFLEAVKTL